MRWSRLPRLLASHPLAVDAVLATCIAGMSLRLAMQGYPSAERPFDTLGVALTLAASLPLTVRRRAPMATLVVVSGATLAYQMLGYWDELNLLGPALALYTVATLRSRPWSLAGALITAPGMLWGTTQGWNGTPIDAAVQSFMWLAALVFFGDGTRRLAERGERLAELTEQLRREQEDRAQRAVTEERLRIAGELHDVVAHHLAVMSVHTGLAWYVVEDDPAQARVALRTASDTGREALDEMRRLLAVLRVDRPAGERPSGDDGYGPAPGLGDLDTLVQRIRAAGVPVGLAVTGEPRPLPPGVELCAYRVIQESLTNVVKHAPGASAAVAVDYGAEDLSVRVTDTGGQGVGPPAPLPPPAPPTGGHGQVGMRERARVYQGTLRAGPLPDGGYEVALTLPTTIATGESAPAVPSG